MTKEEEALDLIQGKNRDNGDKTKEITWALFLKNLNEPKTLELIDLELYKKKKGTYQKVKRTIEQEKRNVSRYKKGNASRYKSSLNTPAIHGCFKAWREAKFFFQSRTIEKRKGKGGSYGLRVQKLCGLSLTPLFFFLNKELIKKEKVLNSQEESILSFLFSPDAVRYRLFKEYRTQDFITAILKFYAKHYLIPYLEKKDKIKLIGTFDKDYLDICLDFKKKKITPPELSDAEFKKNYMHMMNTEIGTSNKKPSKEKQMIQDNLENIGTDFYDSSSHLLKIKGEWFFEDRYNEEYFLKHYYSLHYHYPDIMTSLDLKIMQVLELK